MRFRVISQGPQDSPMVEVRDDRGVPVLPDLVIVHAVQHGNRGSVLLDVEIAPRRREPVRATALP